MSPSRKTLSLVLVGALALAGAACSSSSDDPLGGDQGQLTVRLHDQAAPNITQANVTFSEVQVHQVGGDWTSINGTFPMTVDLLTLVSGNTATLASGMIPAGTYDRIRVTITAADLVVDGSPVGVPIPGGSLTVEVALNPPVTVVDGQDTTLTLDFEVGGSFQVVGTTWVVTPQITVDPS